MSTQVLAGAAMVAVAVPVAWWSVSGGRAVAPAVLRRGITAPTDLRTAVLQTSARERALEPAIDALAARARRLTPAGMLAGLERRLAAAGLQGRWTIERVLAAKLALGIVGTLLGLLQVAGGPTAKTSLAAATFVALGWFTPDVLLSQRATKRRVAVQRELADTMDQVTIAVEAGLGFEAAMARVAQSGRGVLAEELARTLQDIQLGVPRTESLESLAARCDVPELRQFVSAVRQAERYGLPIANVLRIQSSEIREKRRQRAEEHAMKIPVKVLFPLIFCILPTLFIVVIGPAVIRVADSNFSG